MNLFFIKIKQTRGTSLLELLVAVTIFAVIILSSAQIFKVVIDGQRNVMSAQNVQENIRYTMEKISREARMAHISNRDCEAFVAPLSPTLVRANYKVFNVAIGPYSDILYFKNKDDKCVAYYLRDNYLRVKAETLSGEVVSADITPSKIEVSNLRFYAVGDVVGAFHSLQSYVTISMDIKSVGPELHEQSMKIQSTISSRYYE